MMTEKSSSSSFKEEKRKKNEKQNVEFFPSATNVLLLLAYGMKDAIRTKCRQMLCNAIKFDDGIPKGCTDFEKLAAELEDAIYNVFRNIDKKYIRRIRSRVFNLKDPKNPSLRLNYIRGVVSPKTLATMTPEEMASDEMKQIRENFRKKTLKCGNDCKF
ncbi:transcription elongation factor S-II-like [Teleopsis dalmanni]|uniref:transcription elongation factor S-II-like n=1 Tax=Teleopsis dalmanni TaxID=139649 RepID=UPI0018CE0A88|nr:transcription elongation factor S-II-like [Teleopsis dalmanni]